jgi:cytoskeletal protein RodZ
MREAIKRGATIQIEGFERRLRDQEAQRASQGDPLRELARLMQEQENDKTAQRYAQIFDDHRQPAEEPQTDFGFHPDTRQEAMRAAAAQEDYVAHPAWQEPAQHFSDEDLPPPLRGSVYEGHQPQGAAPERADWGRRLAAPADFSAQRAQEFYPENVRAAGHHSPAHEPQMADYDAFDPAQAEEFYSEEHAAYEDFPAYAEASEGAERVRRGFRVKPWHAVALAAIVGALGVGWGVARIKGVAGSREIATIAAPAGPTKVAPAAEASQTAKEVATVLDRGQETPVQGVVPNQEAPVEPVVEPPRQAASETFRRVKTVAIREDGGVNPATAPAAVGRAANDTAPPPPAAATTTPQNAAPPATTAQTAQKQPQRKKVAAAPAEPAKVLPAEPASQEAAAPSESSAEPPSSGSALVQFGSVPNESEARALANKVAQKYGSRLGGHKPTWKTAEVNDKTVYRVRVGGLSKEAATSLCKRVKNDGGDCFVANK